MAINKRNNFKRIAYKRRDLICKQIYSLRNLKNTSFYKYDDLEITMLFDDIKNELIETLSYLKKK